MTPRLRPPVLPLAALLAGSCLVMGCSDAAVEEARSNREAVSAAADAFAEAIRRSGADDPTTELEAIASQLDATARSGDPAANLLLAQVRLDLGRRRLEDAISTERRIAARRTAALTTLTEATAFSSGADAIRAIGFPAERRRLESSLAAAEGGVSSSRSELRELDQRTRLREVEIERLNLGVLAAEERANGYLELASRESIVGAPEYLELAAEARADAGRTRIVIAFERQRVESDTGDMRAARNLAVSSADVDGSSKGLEALDTTDASLARQAAALAETGMLLRESILRSATPDADESILGGERIGLALEEARSEFEAAATAAGRTASGADRSLQSSARVLRLSADLGRLTADLVDAERLEAEANLVAALGESPSEAERLRTAAASSRERATQLLAETEESVASLPSSGPAARMLQAELTSAMGRLSGTSGSNASDAPGGAGLPAASRGSSSSEPPFDTADDLARFIASGAISNAAPDILEDVLVAGSRGGKRMLNATIAFARAEDDARLAMIEVFGTANRDPDAFGPFEGGEILSRGDGEAEFGTDTASMRLFERDGAWRIDYEQLMEASGMSDPAALSAAAALLEPFSDQLGPFFRMFAQRIRNGEFATAEEAQAEMAQAMAQALKQNAVAGGGRR